MRTVLALAFFIFGTAQAGGTPALDQRAAVEASQSMIGSMPGDYTMLDREGQPVHMSSYRGKPLLVSFIYTDLPPKSWTRR